MARTDILLGVHGAGLTQLLYLPDKSTIVELSSMAFIVRWHFQLMSAWLDHDYHIVEVTIDELDSSQPVTIINRDNFVQSINHIAKGVIYQRCKTRSQKEIGRAHV